MLEQGQPFESLDDNVENATDSERHIRISSECRDNIHDGTRQTCQDEFVVSSPRENVPSDDDMRESHHGRRVPATQRDDVYYPRQQQRPQQQKEREDIAMERSLQTFISNLAESERRLQKNSSQLEAVEKEKMELQNENRRLKIQLEERTSLPMNDERRKSATELELNLKVFELTEKMKEKEAHASKLEKKVVSLSENSERLEKELSHANELTQTTSKRMSEETKTLMSKLKKKVETEHQLNEKIKDLAGELEDKEKYIEMVEKTSYARVETMKLKEGNNDANDDVEKLDVEREVEEMKKLGLREQNQAEIIELSLARAEGFRINMDRMKETEQNLNTKIKLLSARLEEQNMKERELNNAKAHAKSLESKMQDMEEDEQKLFKKIAQLTARLQQKDTSDRKVTEKSEKIKAESLARVKRLSLQVDSLSVNEKKLKETVAELTSQLKEKEENEKTFDVQNSKMASKIEHERHSAQKEKRELLACIESMKAEIDRVTKNETQLKSQVPNLASRLKEVDSKVIFLRSEAFEMESRLEEQQKLLLKATSELEEEQKKSASIEAKSEQDRNKFDEDRTELESKVETLQAEVEELRNNEAALKEKITDHTTKLESEQEEAKKRKSCAKSLELRCAARTADVNRLKELLNETMAQASYKNALLEGDLRQKVENERVLKEKLSRLEAGSVVKTDSFSTLGSGSARKKKSMSRGRHGIGNGTGRRNNTPRRHAYKNTEFSNIPEKKLIRVLPSDDDDNEDASVTSYDTNAATKKEAKKHSSKERSHRNKTKSRRSKLASAGYDTKPQAQSDQSFSDDEEDDDDDDDDDSGVTDMFLKTLNPLNPVVDAVYPTVASMTEFIKKFDDWTDPLTQNEDRSDSENVHRTSRVDHSHGSKNRTKKGKKSRGRSSSKKKVITKSHRSRSRRKVECDEGEPSVVGDGFFA